MVTITVGDTYSKLHNCPPRILAEIRCVVRAKPEGYYHMPKYRSGMWDGYISLMRGMHYFPTGLLQDVVDVLHKADVTVVCEYNVHKVDVQDVTENMLHGIVMRDYQIDATRTLLERERGVARMATNSGKTVVIAAIIKCLGNKNALVVVNSKELLYQTSNRLQNMLGRDIGLVGDGHHSDSDVCVATIQTLSSLRLRAGCWTGRFASNDVLIIDECHHVSGNRTFDVLMEIPGWYRFGLSGTPLRSQALRDLKLIAATGPVCVDISNSYLIQNGWSAVPTIHMVDVGTDDDKFWKLSYHDAYDVCIVNNVFRNGVIAHIAMQEQGGNSSVLVIVDRIKHGLILQKMIPGSCFLCGESDIELRMAALSRLAEGGGQVVIATNIFDEGVDVPALDVIILAGGGKSYIRLLQRLGRGLRKKEGNNKLTVYDFWDDINEYLVAHSEKRYDTYIEEGFEVVYVS